MPDVNITSKKHKIKPRVTDKNITQITDAAKEVFDLSELEWELTGSTPYLEFYENPSLLGRLPTIDTGPVKARVPGSVQMSLLDAGLLPDWNTGDHIRACEWVENRHWLYQTTLPDSWFTHTSGKPVKDFILCCDGLDYSGWIYLNGKMLSRFEGTHIPVRVSLAESLKIGGNELCILFDFPPRWLGQFGFTSEMTDWKTRFNYTWDWIPRFVQIGIWDRIRIERISGSFFSDFRCAPDADPDSKEGLLWIQSHIDGINATGISCTLSYNGKIGKCCCLRPNLSKRYGSVGVDSDGDGIGLTFVRIGSESRHTVAS